MMEHHADNVIRLYVTIKQALSGVLEEGLLLLRLQTSALQTMHCLIMTEAGAILHSSILIWLNPLGKRLVSIEVELFQSFTKGIEQDWNVFFLSFCIITVYLGRLVYIIVLLEYFWIQGPVC